MDDHGLNPTEMAEMKDFAIGHQSLLGTLKAHFEKNMNRHIDLEWSNVQARLETNAEKL